MHTMPTRRRLPALLLVVLWLAMIAVPAGPATAEEPAIEGYTDQLSYRPGEKVAFHLSAKAAQARVKIQRIGGENRVVLEQDGITIGSHPMPVKASSDGCNWPVAWSFAVPADWKSGVYEAAFTPAAGGKPAVIHFMVRSAQPGKTSKILFQLSTNTWNAYTNSGGHSLYSYHDVAGLQGHRVSFNRPQHSGMINSWEVPFLRWAERSGYTLDYAANSDLEFHPEELAGYRLVLSVGHDEYWSSPMRDHLEAFIKNGGNVAFFSGNTCCWQVRSEDGGRALTCWKQFFN
ncbi:MAG: N,N-dimethylformamidase beta subunit family domain-containing protein, partial [Planctomycetia bacterium]